MLVKECTSKISFSHAFPAPKSSTPVKFSHLPVWGCRLRTQAWSAVNRWVSGSGAPFPERICAPRGRAALLARYSPPMGSERPVNYGRSFRSTGRIRATLGVDAQQWSYCVNGGWRLPLRCTMHPEIPRIGNTGCAVGWLVGVRSPLIVSAGVGWLALVVHWMALVGCSIGRRLR